eukprot:114770-Chlamydomonas_euryale.AAC.1
MVRRRVTPTWKMSRNSARSLHWKGSSSGRTRRQLIRFWQLVNCAAEVTAAAARRREGVRGVVMRGRHAQAAD